MTKSKRPRSTSHRWFSAACAFGLVVVAATGCSDDTSGTDIDIPGGGTSSGGTSPQTGGSSTRAGSSNSNADGGTADGGAPEGGAPGAGTSSGGNAGSVGTSGNGGSSSGGTGTAGTTTGGGNAGTGGSGGNAGTAGTANGGNAGTVGSAGTSSAGNAGTSSGGNAGTSGSGGASGGGNAGTGGSGGSGGGANQTCGNGTVEGTEQCDGMGPTRLCSDDCVKVASQECVDCEQAGDCQYSSDNCLGPAATPFSKEQTATCYDTLECILSSGCLEGAGNTLGKCYCGTLSTAACGAAPFDLKQAGAPNGPCAAIMQKGQPGVTSNSSILGALTNKSRPAGAAGQRLNCDKTDEACTPLCIVK